MMFGIERLNMKDWIRDHLWKPLFNRGGENKRMKIMVDRDEINVADASFFNSRIFVTDPDFNSFEDDFDDSDFL